MRALAGITLRPYLRLEVEGRERVPPEGAFVCAANHRSYLDPIVLQMAIPERRLVYLMTSDWYDRPLLKPFFKLMHAVPVREGARQQREAFVRALGALRSGHPVGIFPEGRISPDGTLLPFRPGVVRLASRAGVPIVPAGISGTERALPKGKVFVRPAKVRIRFGVPLPPPALEGLDRAERRAREKEEAERLRAAVAALVAPAD